jgi:hypothetical protein
MGETQSKLLLEQRGRGMVWERHGHVMACVNYPVLRHPVVAVRESFRDLPRKLPCDQGLQAC